MNKFLLFNIFVLYCCELIGQTINTDSVIQKHSQYLYQGREKPTHESKLKGTINKYNEWFDVTHYRLDLAPALAEKKLSGSVTISYTVKGNTSMDTLLLNLHRNFGIERIADENQKQLAYRRTGDFIYVYVPDKHNHSLTVHYSGTPVVAKKPPWDGGFVWDSYTDNTGKRIPWVGVACEGIGASTWWPCKDHPSDEPDSVTISVQTPDTLFCKANGRLFSVTKSNGTKTYTWKVQNKINLYNVTINIAKYYEIQDTIQGIKGPLNCTYYILQQPTKQLQDFFHTEASRYIHFMEKTFGAYPFYSDGYSLVQTKYWGMEHQSAIAYGNNFQRNEFGFDFIIVHETGHEWFGNSVSTDDHAGLWIHESFTTYTEALFVEYYQGRKKAEEYLASQRKYIKNGESMLGIPNSAFNAWKTSDIYYKGTWALHTLRTLVDNDAVWFGWLRSLYETHKYSEISTSKILDYFDKLPIPYAKALMLEYLINPEVISIQETREKSGSLYLSTIIDYDFSGMLSHLYAKQPVKKVSANTYVFQQNKISKSASAKNILIDLK
jgi:aminopeptidase N